MPATTSAIVSSNCLIILNMLKTLIAFCRGSCRLKWLRDLVKYSWKNVLK